MTENDEREEVPVDISNRAVDKGWSLWGLVRAGWNAKEGVSSPIQPGQGKNTSFNQRHKLYNKYFI